jgi:RimJ/RimL family protein N-acetyltransferase
MIEMTGSKMQASDTSAIRNTTRLILRQPEAPDIDFITDMFSRNEVVAHRPDPRPDTPEESAARLARDMAHWRDHSFG